MDDSIINLIIFGVVSWTTLFLLTRKLFPNRSFDFCNRLVSTIHAILAVTLSSISVQDWSCPLCPLASRSSHKQMKALAVTVAYLIYDFVCCLFDKQVKIDNLIHHLVSVVGLGAGLAYQWCGSEMVAALCVTEISSPFLHMREILKELGYKDTDLNLAADVLFAVIFSCARMIGGPYLTYVTLSADNPILIKAMALGLQLVSAFWFYKIARMIMYKFSRRNKAKIALSNSCNMKLKWKMPIFDMILLQFDPYSQSDFEDTIVAKWKPFLDLHSPNIPRILNNIEIWEGDKFGSGYIMCNFQSQQDVVDFLKRLWKLYIAIK